jgi:AbrB family looped-hinge helix DNA binding protein
MSKVTTKLQVTVPKEIADRYGIRPGSEIDWIPAGETLRIVPSGAAAVAVDPEERLKLFDASTARQRKRQSRRPVKPAKHRGWKRDDLYGRGVPR